ncbi:ABC transporter substrate-binding protein [Bacillus sp. 31A1R]|uniref:ABC transporter substrate-binding protein n=1 Tax=Robertmurraya mangrovi TaxID=3098077 RepID=A0ABU5J2G4_9BACI|nr:ABC transporter substrate-binding protein [Bacillus sp. 31A1R]MDZ5473599.1 ABC transporter substrate-binding protein [Bacillus sp. 31A1R]
MKLKVKRFFTGALTSILSIGLLVGCADGGDKNEGAGGKTELELFSNKSESIDTLKKLISKFEEQNPDVKIKLNAPPEAETVLKTRLTKNDLPELLAIGGNATYGELARAGVFANFEGTEMLNNIQPAYVEMLNRLVGPEKEGVFGVPYATNANAVIYNKDMFEELGVTVPTTWDEFISVLDKIQASGQTPIYFTLKDAWTALIPWNSVAANVQPENFAQKKNNAETTFKESYPEVADKMLQLLNYGHKDNFGVGYGDGNTAFAKGGSAIYLQGNWAIPEIKKANPDINLGVFPMPVTNTPDNNNLVSGVDVLLTMREDMQDNEQARKFIEFMINEENATQYTSEQKAFSAVQGVFQEEPEFEGIRKNFEEGRLTSFPDHYYPAGMGAENLIQDFLLKKDAGKFLDKMDQEWNKAINR